MKSAKVISIALFAGLLSVILAGYGCSDSLTNPDPGNTRPAGFTDKQWLGKQLFFDTHLSEPAGLACAGCHASQVGWTGPDELTDRGGAA